MPESTFRTIQMGAANGLGFGLLVEIFVRLSYEYESRLAASGTWHTNATIDSLPYPFQWWYLPLLSLVLVIVASFFVHQFFRTYIRSTIWLWEVIGLLAVAELYVLTFAIDWLNAHFSMLKSDYWQFAYSIKLLPWILLVPSLLVYNFLFGWVTKQLRSQH